jgi:hypothetical protein
MTSSSTQTASRCFPPDMMLATFVVKKQEKNKSINTKHCIQDNEKECKG